MVEFTSITAGVSAIKAAQDVAAALVKGGLSPEKAELKLRLADLTNSLAEARTSLGQASEELADKDKMIAHLRELLRLKGSVVKSGDAYFDVGGNGQAKGEPYCLSCWESGRGLFHLATSTAEHRQRVCPTCKHEFDWRRIIRPQ